MGIQPKWIRAAIAPWVVAVALAVGCDDPATRTAQRASTTAPEKSTTEAPVGVDAQPAGATQPQTSTADTRPANAFLSVEGRMTEFPPARLRLTKTDEGVSALLYSDDPPNAASAGYTGNGFYFEFALQISDAAEVDGAEYRYKADDSEPSESPNGILLHGTRYHLQPQDLVIKFSGEGPKVMAHVVGRFLVVRTTKNATVDGVVVPEHAGVEGTLYVTAEVKEQK